MTPCRQQLLEQDLTHLNIIGDEGRPTRLRELAPSRPVYPRRQHPTHAASVVSWPEDAT